MKLAVIFDLDGVITDTAALHYKAWGKIVETIGIKLDYSINEQIKGLSRMDSLEKLLTFADNPMLFSNAEKEQLADEKNHYYRELITTLTPDDVLPGIRELLEILKEQGIPVGLASASHNAPDILRKLKLDHLFNFIADPALVKKGKPAPDLFLLAAKGLGIPPQNCIGIEDATSGIQAINTAGMFSIGVGNKHELKEADFIVASPGELSLNMILSI